MTKIISVTVKPRSSQNEIEKIDDSSYVVKLKASPVDGEANDLLIKLMAKYFGLTRDKIDIKTGKRSKKKLLIIYG